MKARRDAGVCWEKAKNLILNQQGRGLTEGQMVLHLPSCSLLKNSMNLATKNMRNTSPWAKSCWATTESSKR